MSSRKSKQKQKMRGPSRPVDPRYTARRISPKRGPDTFAIWLVGISTGLVVLLVFWVATANRGNTAQTPITNQQPTIAAAVPTPLPPFATATALAYATQTGDLPRISVEELKPLLAANDVKLIDVRGKAQFDSQHIKGATNVPEAETMTRIKDFPKTGNLVVYCQ